MNAIARFASAVALALPLSGCFFFYIPGSLMQSASDSISGNVGNLCVSPGTKVGGQIKMPPDDHIGTVMKLEGSSSGCTNPARPIRAVVEAN